MTEKYTPILVVPAVPHEGGIRFLHRDAKIDIGPEMAEKVWKILSLSNGYNKLSDIIKALKIPDGKNPDKDNPGKEIAKKGKEVAEKGEEITETGEKDTENSEEITEIVSELAEMELITDARHQFLHFHRISNYPTAINSDLTQQEVETYTKSKRLSVKSGKKLQFQTDTASALSSIIAKRRSCRRFSTRKMTVGQIGSICHYAYFIPNHSVPSGGALYPLKLFVIVEEPQIGLEPGYYEYDAEQDELVLYNSEVDTEQLKYCFNQEEMPFGSSMQIIIAADLMRQPYKYANRGYRLTLLEAGHAAENICLYCAEQGLGTCELGGVQDEPLQRELALEENVWPLLAIPVGYPAEDEGETLNKVRFVEERTGADHPVKEVWTRAFGENGAFFGAAATYLDGKHTVQYAGATSPSYADAIFKATIEGCERYLSSQARVDFRGSAEQIFERPGEQAPAKQVPGKWLDPRKYFPLTDEQAQSCGVKPFTEELVINWTLGTHYDGSEIYVPSDLVFYGQQDDTNRIYYGNSSGTAAHFDFQEAKMRAVTELIERDALMVNWFSQEPPGIIAEELLPIHVRKRARHWRGQKREVSVLSIPSDFGAVFETIITSADYPCFVCGAAAAIDDKTLEPAILKSLQEAEYNLLLALRYPEQVAPDPEGVLTPADHGKFYQFRDNAEKLHWLRKGCKVYDLPKLGGLDWPYEERLELTTVDLSVRGSDLKAVKVFSPFLVPINFGLHSAHFMHPALSRLASVHPDSLITPHYFA